MPPVPGPVPVSLCCYTPIPIPSQSVPNSHDDSQWYFLPGPVICSSSRPHSGLFNTISLGHVRRHSNLLVNAVGIVLRLDRNAAVAWDKLVLSSNTLGALELALSVHPVARVQNNSVLVSLQLSLDTAVLAR